jgi:hypothetical protein
MASRPQSNATIPRELSSRYLSRSRVQKEICSYKHLELSVIRVRNRPGMEQKYVRTDGEHIADHLLGRVRSLKNSPLRLLASVLMLSSCGQDPLHMSYRTVQGNFVLHRWEDGKTYYLERKGRDVSGGGVLDGTVTAIGWNSSYIVARRHALFAGDPDGWMIVSVRDRSVRGPYSDDQVKAMPEMRGITALSSEQAFKELR